MSAILRPLAYLLSARWAREGLQAVFFIYLARKSAPTYGEFMLSLGLGSILLMGVEFGLNYHLVGEIIRKGEKAGETLSQALALKVCLLTVALAGTWRFVSWQNYEAQLAWIMLLMGAGVGLEGLASTFFVALQVAGRQDLEGKIRTVAAALGFGYGLITLALGVPPILIVLFKWVEALTNLVGGALTVRRLQGFSWRRPNLESMRRLLWTASIFAIIELVAAIYNKANIFFLQNHGGVNAVAQYSAPWQIVEGLTALVSNLLLHQVMFPIFVRLWGTDQEEISRLARATARWLTLAAFPLMFFLFVESDRIIPLIFGPRFQDAVWLLKYLAPAIIIAFLHNLAGFLMMSMDRQRLLLLFYLGGLLANLGLCSWVIPLAPLPGAAAAIVLTKGVVALMTVLYVQRRLQIITLALLRDMAVISLVALILYGVGKIHLPRLLAESLALAPFLWAGWRWRRLDKRQ
ncbi:MAG: polysaccharide biosynthesis protein [Deltaproteobacteria bacterium]|nr:polysaccharide biosynthesis protein [Deltaproteobacteria bacterium]